jgi:hypothetical protein
MTLSGVTTVALVRASAYLAEHHVHTYMHVSGPGEGCW